MSNTDAHLCQRLSGDPAGQDLEAAHAPVGNTEDGQNSRDKVVTKCEVFLSSDLQSA
jgi:hypothetical protein